MNNISTYLRNKLAGAVLRGEDFTPPADVWLALYATDPTPDDTATEVSGSGYARVKLTFGAPTTGICVLSQDATFPAATGSQGSVGFGGIRDAQSGGNLLFSGPLAASQLVSANGVVQFKSGQISCGFN
jgi:hypothetical protein